MKIKLRSIAGLVVCFVLVGCLEKKEELAEEEFPSTSPGSPASPSNPNTGNPGGGCDSTVASMATVLMTVPTQEIVPLCDGDLLMQNLSNNSVGLINVKSLQLKNEWQLTATPTQMILDKERKYLYVALSGASRIARIDIYSGTSNIDYINTSSPVTGLAFGETGFLFANLAASGGYYGNVALVDLTTMSVSGTITGSIAKLMIYNPDRDELIASSAGLSPAGLRRYSFNASVPSLTLVEHVHGGGSNASQLVISPDFTKFALAAGSGNTDLGYNLYDYSTNSFAATNGTYNVGAYPVGADFSPDGKYFVTSDTNVIKVFNTTTHVLYKQISLAGYSCDYSDFKRVKFSPGGKTIYAYIMCGFNDDSGILFVTPFN